MLSLVNGKKNPQEPELPPAMFLREQWKFYACY